MTAPIDVLLSVVLSGSVALACRGQLRQTPHAWYATRYFAALGAFDLMLFLPAAAYRYVFPIDGAFMYLFDASRYAAGTVALAVLAIAAASVGTFWLGDHCSRSGRIWLLLAVLGAAAVGIAVIATLGAPRIHLVGTHSQWVGSFGLLPMARTELLLAIVVMGLCMLVGWSYIVVQFVKEGVALARASR